jgi:molybdopterin biosynthesis enzyme
VRVWRRPRLLACLGPQRAAPGPRRAPCCLGVVPEEGRSEAVAAEWCQQDSGVKVTPTSSLLLSGKHAMRHNSRNR